MSGEVRAVFDPYVMFPEAAKRVEILEDIKRKWPLIVGKDAAKYSMPYDLGVSGLWVQVDRKKKFARDTLTKSKKSIERRLARKCGYEPAGEFELTLTDEVPVRGRTAKRQ